MSVLDELSSGVGDRIQRSTHEVARKCLANPELIKELVAGLSSKNKFVRADTGEALVFIGTEKPELIAPLLEKILPLITDKYTRARWEAMHAVSLITPLKPKLIAGLLIEIQEIALNDKSVIVRDNAVQTIVNLAGSGPSYARLALPVLLELLAHWRERHAARILTGFKNILKIFPEVRQKVLEPAELYVSSSRPSVAKAAKALIVPPKKPRLVPDGTK